ncbi:testis-expressed protein 47 [Menidia menidia]
MNTSQELKSFSLNSGKDWEKEEEDRITLYDAMYAEKRENIVLQRLVVVARLPPDSADGTQLGAHWEDLTFQLGRAHRWDQITGLLLVYPACLLHVIESSREILIAVLKDLQLMQQQPERAVLEAKIVFMGLNIHSRMFQQWSYKVLNKNQVIGNEAMTGHEEEESTESLVCSVLSALQSLTQKLDFSKTTRPGSVLDGSPDLIVPEGTLEKLLRRVELNSLQQHLQLYDSPLNTCIQVGQVNPRSFLPNF